MKGLALRARLALWHAAAAALILAAGAIAGDRFLSHRVLQQLDAALLALAETEAASGVDDSGGDFRLEGRIISRKDDSLDSLDKLVQVVTPNGRIVARSPATGPALPAPPALMARLGLGRVVVETIPDLGGQALRMVALPVELEGKFRYAVQVATPLRATTEFLQSARLLVLAGGGTLLGAVTLIGTLLTRRALRPFDRMVMQARRIGESSLRERLPDPAVQDELGRLAIALNEMLERIERVLQSQRRFTADASHEMRSPLSRLRTELEVTLDRPRGREEYEAVLRSALEEVERLSRLTEALLALARLDADELPPMAPSPVALLPLVQEELQRLQPEVEKRDIRCEVRGSELHAVRGSPDALRLVVANLLQNAVKFSPSKGEITVTLAAEAEEAVLAVSDTGPGIAPGEAARIFDRFYRGSASSPDTPGVGLGLAIVRAIVVRYGGRIAVASPPGAGATFTFFLPLAGAPANSSCDSPTHPKRGS